MENRMTAIELYNDIVSAIDECRAEYPEITTVLDDTASIEWIRSYITAVHATDRHAPAPTADDVRAMARDLGYERDDSTTQVLASMGTAGIMLAIQRARIQRDYGVSPWSEGRIIEYMTMLIELSDAGMGGMTIADAIVELDSLADKD